MEQATGRDDEGCEWAGVFHLVNNFEVILGAPFLSLCVGAGEIIATNEHEWALILDRWEAGEIYRRERRELRQGRQGV